MTSVAEFKKALTSRLTERSLSVTLWRSGSRRSANLIEISTKPIPTVLYAKISNSDPGFWGLTKNQLDRLNNNQVRWFAVLLAASHTDGYLFSSYQINQRIKDGTFELSIDGDYKIHENTDCSARHAFRGLTNLVTRIF